MHWKSELVNGTEAHTRKEPLVAGPELANGGVAGWETYATVG